MGQLILIWVRFHLGANGGGADADLNIYGGWQH